MHKRRGLKRLPRRFAGELGGGQAAQLIVDQGQQLLCSPIVAPLNGVQNASDFRHRGPNAARYNGQE